MANATEIAVAEAKRRAELALLNRIIKEAGQTLEYEAFKARLEQLRDEKSASE